MSKARKSIMELTRTYLSRRKTPVTQEQVARGIKRQDNESTVGRYLRELHANGEIRKVASRPSRYAL